MSKRLNTLKGVITTLAIVLFASMLAFSETAGRAVVASELAQKGLNKQAKRVMLTGKKEEYV